jgi:potassium voltage-gated channel Eag-related subfamily H member 8
MSVSVSPSKYTKRKETIKQSLSQL